MNKPIEFLVLLGIKPTKLACFETCYREMILSEVKTQ